MRSKQAMAVVIVMAVAIGGSMAHGCAEATGVSMPKAISWEISEFWRKTIRPLWTWRENAKADEGDVPELADPAVASQGLPSRQ